MVGDRRQGRALLAAMTLVFVVALGVCAGSEQAGNPLLAKLGVDQQASALQAGGNMEGKEVRFGIANSALWATATTAASNGSVNAMHDSFTPLGGLVPMAMIQLGEVIFGGVGSGLYGMLLWAVIAMFVAGLMVGRTPEYLGKKIEAKEVKMTMLAVLVLPLLMLGFTAIATVLPSAVASIANPGPHGFSEILYAYVSGAGNNEQFVVLQVTARRSQGEVRYDDVKDHIRQQLSQELGIRRYLDHLRKATYVEIRM